MSSSSVESAFQFCEKLVSDFSWKRLLFLLFVVAMVVGSFLYYQQISKSIAISRLGNEIGLLEQLSRLSDDPVIEADETLTASLESLKLRLSGLSGSGPAEIAEAGYLFKFAMYAAPWIVLTVIMFLASDTRDDFGKVIGGVCALAIPVALLGPLLPAFEPKWVSYYALPIVVCLLLVLLITLLFRKK